MAETLDIVSGESYIHESDLEIAGSLEELGELEEIESVEEVEELEELEENAELREQEELEELEIVKEIIPLIIEKDIENIEYIETVADKKDTDEYDVEYISNEWIKEYNRNINIMDTVFEEIRKQKMEDETGFCRDGYSGRN